MEKQLKTIRITTLLLFALLLFKQAEGQYEKINNNGLDIYYRIFGQGQPILIIYKHSDSRELIQRFQNYCTINISEIIKNYNNNAGYTEYSIQIVESKREQSHYSHKAKIINNGS
jgi:lauroyl/myristoyl acyltransferase